MKRSNCAFQNGGILDQSIALRWRLAKESFDIGADGRVAAPDAPGLGVTLDPAVVAEFRKA